MATKSDDGERLIQQYLALIDEAFDHKAWHGTTLKGSLRRVTATQAAWRPGRTRHNMWEIVVHAAYWKYAVERRLMGTPRGTFALKGSNWFARPEIGARTEAAWRRDVALLDQQHRALRASVARLAPAEILTPSRRGQPTHAFLLRGIAAHDLYHAGQIQLIKRLLPARLR
ncbi:MAG: DinB family protein [Vicinamibacterales bacterium]